MPSKLHNRILLLITVLFTSFFVANYSSHKVMFYGDALGYYSYLPSAFIYNNLVSYAPLPRDKGISEYVLSYTKPRREETDTSKIIINQYTYGVALMEAPFFYLAHLFELARGGSANGYSDAYDRMIKVSTLFYCLLGLVMVYRILRRYFNETQSVMGIIAVLLGTNLFWFSIFQAGMSHIPLFFLYALLMWLTIRVYERPSMALFASVGLTAGMITIIRPTDIICLLIPLLYEVYSGATLKKKLVFLRENLKGISVAALAFVLPIIPQLVYWKVLTGNWLYYSYREQSFDWANPKILDGLFYYSNGWLPYSPVMIFALIGLLFYKRFKSWVWCVWLLLPIYIYIIYSWYCYRYINGLGSRPMIHLYPLLALPLTVFIQFIGQRRVWMRVAFGAIVVFFMAMNINYSLQQMRGLIWSEESNMAFNLQMLFKTELEYDDLVVNDIGEWQPDTAKVHKLFTLAEEHYDDSAVSEKIVPDPITGHKYVYYMHDEEFQELQLMGKYNKSLHKDAKWIKVSGRFMYPIAPDYFKHMFVLSVTDKLWKGSRIENKTFDWHTIPGHDHLTLFDYKQNEWGRIYYFAKIPSNLADGDELKLYVWSLNKVDIYIDDLSIELYN